MAFRLGAVGNRRNGTPRRPPTPVVERMGTRRAGNRHGRPASRIRFCCVTPEDHGVLIDCALSTDEEGLKGQVATGRQVVPFDKQTQPGEVR